MIRKPSEFVSPAELALIHDTSMRLLAQVGIEFHHDEAIAVFKNHGARVDGRTIYLSEDLVMKAVATAPSHFTIWARDPAKSVEIGNGRPIFAPGYGAPFILDLDGSYRKATMADYKRLIRLADSLPNQDLSGYLLVHPDDLPETAAHLKMIQAGMVHSDKPFMGSSEGEIQAGHTMKMVEILFGQDPAGLAERPVTMALVDSLSPLQYSTEMTGALMEYARWRQPVLLTALVMAGATGPITLAGVLAQQNAELLAGITLAQLVNPGTPVIYGSASTIMDMRTGGLAIGNPELSIILIVAAQLARSYNLPSRGGGALTDAHGPDAQAGFESMLAMTSAIQADVDFVLHAAGMLSSYLAFSYEKFVIDDEICGSVRHYRQGLEVTPETLAFEIMARVGPGGNFLKERHTASRCRTEFWQPSLSNRGRLETWLADGRPDLARRAHRRWQDLLAEHEDPPLDAVTARQLQAYVNEHGGLDNH